DAVLAPLRESVSQVVEALANVAGGSGSPVDPAPSPILGPIVGGLLREPSESRLPSAETPSTLTGEPPPADAVVDGVTLPEPLPEVVLVLVPSHLFPPPGPTAFPQPSSAPVPVRV